MYYVQEGVGPESLHQARFFSARVSSATISVPVDLFTVLSPSEIWGWLPRCGRFAKKHFTNHRHSDRLLRFVKKHLATHKHSSARL